jgi:methylglutaconyl-CoA hydratase
VKPVSYQFLDIRRDGPLEHITLNRPEVRNAFNEEVIAELTAWAADITERALKQQVRAALLAGAGKVFLEKRKPSWSA